MKKKTVQKCGSILLVIAILFAQQMTVQAQNVVGNDIIQPIRGTAELMERAENRINEFYEKEGINFDVFCDISNKVQPMSRMLVPRVEIDEKEIATYKTSQFLGETVNSSGEVEKMYALTGIVTYANPSPSNTQSNGGCTISTTIYCAWNSNGMSLRLLRSEANLSGSLRPSSLLMGNALYTGWSTNLKYTKTKTVNLPSNGIHVLYPDYTGYVTDYASYIIGEDTVSFGGGGTLKTQVVCSPK